MNEFRTQTEDLYDYLKENGSITQMKALRELGIMRLASRISDLRRQGVPISTEMITVKAKNGRKASVARYTLIEEA